VTARIAERICEHRIKSNPESFTAKYNVYKLVYYKKFATIKDAIAEEKRIKGGSRLKKIELVNSINPEWNDLFNSI
jgi:putative endonuclease